LEREGGGFEFRLWSERMEKFFVSCEGRDLWPIIYLNKELQEGEDVCVCVCT